MRLYLEILIEQTMRTMEFRISLSAAIFATEARIHRLCKVAGIIKANCLAGPVPVLVTQLGPDRSSERKAALITAATGKTPHFVSNLLDKVRSGIFQPGRTALEYGPLTPEYPIGKALGDMEQMRVVIKDLRRAELVAVENRNRVRAGARAESHEPSLAEDPTTRVGRG
jgi:hypothetical protein